MIQDTLSEPALYTAAESMLIWTAAPVLINVTKISCMPMRKNITGRLLEPGNTLSATPPSLRQWVVRLRQRQAEEGPFPAVSVSQSRLKERVEGNPYAP